MNEKWTEAEAVLVLINHEVERYGFGDAQWSIANSIIARLHKAGYSISRSPGSEPPTTNARLLTHL